MRFSRARRLSGLFLTGVGCLCALACVPADDRRPEKLIIYVNDDSAAARRLMERLDGALQKQLSSQYRVRLRHVVVNLWDSAHIRDAMLASTRMRPAAIVATNSEIAAIAKSVTSD